MFRKKRLLLFSNNKFINRFQFCGTSPYLVALPTVIYSNPWLTLTQADPRGLRIIYNLCRC